MPRQSGAEAEQETKRGTLLDALAMAARIFEANLQQPIGAKARGYLSDRGLGPAAQQRFSLGFSSPERFALRDALAGPGRRRRSDDRGGPAYPRRGDRRALRPVPRPGDVPDPRPRRPGRRLRRPGDGAGREGQISQFARDLALPQGRAALQSSSRPQDAARARRGHRRRGLCRCDRDERGGLRQCRRAARHGADRRSMRAHLGDGARADPLLRRRQRGTQGGLSRDRDGAAADRRGQEPAFCARCPRARIPTTSSGRAARAAMAEVLKGARRLRRHAVPARERRTAHSTRPKAGPRSSGD